MLTTVPMWNIFQLRLQLNALAMLVNFSGFEEILHGRAVLWARQSPEAFFKPYCIPVNRRVASGIAEGSETSLPAEGSPDATFCQPHRCLQPA